MRVTSSSSSLASGRQDPRQAPRQHRLARSGRADEQQVVPPAAAIVQRASCLVLAAHVGQVRVGTRRRRPAPPDLRARQPFRAVRCATTSSEVRAVSALQSTRRAPPPRALPAGTMRLRPVRAVARAAGSTPCNAAQFAGERRVRRAIPALRQRLRIDDTAGGEHTDAIARSKPAADFGRSAGARLTVMRRLGNSRPAHWIAARTRSRLFANGGVAGRPTMVRTGSPGARSTSTVIRRASTPRWRRW